jgi:uncharacterized RDD family membrane protein YckC
MADATILTSQYVQITLTPASAGERLLARAVDTILTTLYPPALLAVIWPFRQYIPGQWLDGNVLIPAVAILLLPALMYSLLWEHFNRGRSPGKRLLGLRVVMKDGSPPTLGACLLRWLLLLIDLHVLQCLGLLSILLTENNQRIGDLAAGTIVIKEKNYHRIHVTLDEFSHLRAGYRPVYPQAENLSLEQINLITQTLVRYDADRLQRIRELAERVRQFLQINPPVDDETLLQTLIRDFQYYALEEI